MKTISAIAIIFGFFVWYVLWGRTLLRSKPWMQWLYTSRIGEWVEINVFKKSETVLFARVKIVTGLLLTLLTQLGTIDITPLLPFVPDGWEGLIHFGFNMLPLTITMLGWADERLREKTTKPLEEVALPEVKPPGVAAAVAKADEAKAEVSAAVEVAKAEGTL